MNVYALSLACKRAAWSHLHTDRGLRSTEGLGLLVIGRHAALDRYSLISMGKYDSTPVGCAFLRTKVDRYVSTLRNGILGCSCVGDLA